MRRYLFFVVVSLLLAVPTSPPAAQCEPPSSGAPPDSSEGSGKSAASTEIPRESPPRSPAEPPADQTARFGDLPPPSDAKPGWSTHGRHVNAWLAALAKQQGLAPRGFLNYRAGDVPFGDDSRAVLLLDHGTPFVFAFQTHHSGYYDRREIHGQQVVLLARDGRILDWLQAENNETMTEIEASVRRGGDLEGQLVAVRIAENCAPGKFNGWYHGDITVTFRGRAYTFWERDERPKKDADIWHVMGLCQAQVVGGKFSVVFPRLEAPEVELRAADSVQIWHPKGGPYERTVIKDRAGTADALSKLSVTATAQPGSFLLQVGDVIVLSMPNGSSISLQFTSPTVLEREYWGRITLGTRDFYDKLCSLASAAEGNAVTIAVAGEKGGSR